MTSENQWPGSRLFCQSAVGRPEGQSRELGLGLCSVWLGPLHLWHKNDQCNVLKHIETKSPEYDVRGMGYDSAGSIDWTVPLALQYPAILVCLSQTLACDCWWYAASFFPLSCNVVGFFSGYPVSDWRTLPMRWIVSRRILLVTCQAL